MQIRKLTGLCGRQNRAPEHKHEMCPHILSKKRSLKMIGNKKTGVKKLAKMKLMMNGDQQRGNKNIRTVQLPRPCTCTADNIRMLQSLLVHTSDEITLQYYISTIPGLKPLMTKLISEDDKEK